jgi:hypothetical protein
VSWRLPEGMTHWDRLRLIVYLKDLESSPDA